MICKTDNSNRIAQPNPYRTILPISLDTSYVGDLVKSQGDGYWLTASNAEAVHLLHFSGNSQADQDKNLATANYPHLVAYGTGKMVAAWATSISGNMTAQVLDTAGGQVSSTFPIAVPGNPYQSFKPFPDGSAAYAAPGTSGTKIRVARILPCNG